MVKGLNFKTWVIILFVLFIVPTVFAEEKSLFSGPVNVNNATVVEGKQLSVAISGSEVAVDYDGLGFFMESGECDTTQFFKACVSNVNRLLSVDVALSVITADLDIQKEIKDGKDEVALGQTFTVKMNMTNTGDRTIPNLKIKEDIKDFQILEVEGCKEENGTLKLETSLNPRSIIICNYKLLTIKEGKFNLETLINYSDGYEDQTKKAKIKVKVIEYTINLSNDAKAEYALGEEGKIKFQLKNKFPHKVDIKKLSIKPKGILVTGSTLKTNRNLDMLNWEGTLEAGATFNYTLDIKVLNVSNEIKTIIEFMPIGEKQTKIFILSLPSDIKQPEIRIKQITNNSIIISLKNPNTNAVLNNIAISIRSTFNNINENKKIVLMKAKEETEIVIETQINKELNVSVPIFFSGQFFTQYDEPLLLSSTDYINLGTRQQNRIMTSNKNDTEAQNNITNQTQESIITKFWSQRSSMMVGVWIFLILGIIITVVLFIKSRKAIKDTK